MFWFLKYCKIKNDFFFDYGHILWDICMCVHNLMDYINLTAWDDEYILDCQNKWPNKTMYFGWIWNLHLQ